MLANDAKFWSPKGREEAAELSWGSSQGDTEVLRSHTWKRWHMIVESLVRSGVGTPSGVVAEFGAGVGLMDEVLDEGTTKFFMLDHTAAYIETRREPLNPRCRHLIWSERALDRLRCEELDWFMSFAVFYHVDEATALALMHEFSQALKPGGKILIYGWNEHGQDTMSRIKQSARKRLFTDYPEYFIRMKEVCAALAPECRTLLVDYGSAVAVVEKVS